MDTSLLDGMDEQQLRRYVDFLLYHYRVADAFWFIKVSEQFDQSTAERLNEEVWEQAGKLGARAIRQRFDIQERGLTGFVRAQRLYPWCTLIGFQIQEEDDQVTITVPSCPVQQARLDRGLDEYVCKEMHRREFTSFAAQIDPRIRVECEFAPPDPHPEDCFCRWRFFLAEESQTDGVASG